MCKTHPAALRFTCFLAAVCSALTWASAGNGAKDAASRGSIIRVPQDKPAIQAAIDSAANGDVVLVGPGVYKEQITLRGKTVTLASLFLQTGNQEHIRRTVLDGTIEKPDGHKGRADFIIMIGEDAGPDTKVVGFTIQGGNDGISCSGKALILHNRFLNNIDKQHTLVGNPLLDKLFRLSPGSVCIDAGTARLVRGQEVLLDLPPIAYCGTAPDLGAHEYQPQDKKPRARRATEPSRAEKPVVIGVIADNQGGNSASDPPGHSRHRELMEMIKDDGAEAILNLGDMVNLLPRMSWPGWMADMKEVFGKDVDNVLENYWLTAGGWEERTINQHWRKKQRQVSLAEWKRRGYVGKYERLGDEPDNKAGQEFYKKHFQYKSRAGQPDEKIIDYDQFGDYHMRHRGVHILSLYISDEWHVPQVFGPHDDLTARKAAWETQVKWFLSRLEEIRKTEPHAPIIAMAHDMDWLIQKGDSFCGRLCAAMRQHKVDLALCGDGHVYKHWPDPVTLKFMVPISWIGAPGSGYFRVTIDEQTIKLDHRDTKGKLLHEFCKRISQQCSPPPK